MLHIGHKELILMFTRRETQSVGFILILQIGGKLLLNNVKYLVELNSNSTDCLSPFVVEV